MIAYRAAGSGQGIRGGAMPTSKRCDAQRDLEAG